MGFGLVGMVVELGVFMGIEYSEKYILVENYFKVF
jgi:hypothetical protein